VTLRRVGDTQLVQALYRAPAGSHPDYPAVDILVNLLGDVPNGRLHRSLVQKGLVSSAWGAERGLHDPGFMYFGASLPKDADIEKARAALLETVEGVRQDKVQAAEVERARTSLLNDFEKTQYDTGTFVRVLSEFEATGDWRLYFLYRDRLRKVTLADVQRVADRYLLSANRVVGLFIPTDGAPERAEIPPTPDLQSALAGYTGGDTVKLGESFDATPANIEKRVVRRTLPNGMRAAFLPKQTRGGRVLVNLTLHWGSEERLRHREVACNFAGAMLMRGTRKHSRAELKDALDKLNASVSVSGDGASIEVRRENLAAALRIVAEVLTEPAFPESEFEELKRAALNGAEAQRGDPAARASERLSRHLYEYPAGHPHYTPTVEERIAQLKETKVADAVACYRELFGATGADLVAVGDFAPAELERLAVELFGGWKTPSPFERVPWVHREKPALDDELRTPDKANAVLRGGLNLRMRDDHPDYPAIVVANYLLGGSSTARLPARVREKDGLSYSTYSSFSANPFDESASFRISSIYAPENRVRVEQAIREEVQRAVRDGFPAQEVEAGKAGLLEARRLQRAQDRALAARLGTYLFAKRTFEWDRDFEAKIAALTPAEVNAALRRHVDPARVSFVKAGDFKK
jgi:zinc protease